MTVDDLVTKFKVYGLKGFYRGAVAEIKNNLTAFFKNTYSQGAEDIELDKLLGHKKDGFYVDVGAYDPHRLSNTKRFYKKGWHGINIEPNIYGYQKFLKKRPRDLNLNMGIGAKPATLTFFQFTPDTLSTFSESEAGYYVELGYKIVKKYKVKVNTLKIVFDKYLKDNKIDFLNVDAEGMDLAVLNSNDWYKYRPTAVCIEAFEHSLQDNKTHLSDLEVFLTGKGYKKVFSNNINSIFIDKS